MKGVGATAEEVLKESARDLHVSKDDWSEELLESHEEFLVLLGGMRERASKIAANVQKRERLVQVSESQQKHTRKVSKRAFDRSPVAYRDVLVATAVPITKGGWCADFR